MIINIPLYDCKVKFELVNSIDELLNLQKKIYKKHKIKNDLIESYGIVIPHFTIYYMIVAKVDNWKNTLFHELYHIVDLITEDRDIHDGESKAYLQGYIGEKIIDYVKL
jgi:hypothetical protein